MAFINTIDVLGDDAVIDSIIQRTITEFKDDVITDVGAYAFYKCTALGTVDLPNVATVGTNAFEGCTALESIAVPKADKLDNNALKGCTSLLEADFPLATILYTSVLEGCSSLARVNAPLATRVYGGALRNCTSLTKLCLPEATRLDANSIRGCANLWCADFSKLTFIDVYVFCGCKNLSALILRNTEAVATLSGTLAFEYTNETTMISTGTGYIYVPRALKDQYAADTNWSTYADQFRALEDYTVDGTVTGALDESKI